MKTAIIYTRSDNKSHENGTAIIPDAFVQEFCRKEDLTILARFSDTSPADQAFKSPGWMALELHLLNNPGTVEYIVIKSLHTIYEEKIGAFFGKLLFLYSLGVTIRVASEISIPIRNSLSESHHAINN